MDREYYNLRGKNLWKRLTEDGTKPIAKEVVATLSTEDIEALILATRPTGAGDNVANETLHFLLEEDLRRNPNGEPVNPPCYHYWKMDGIHLCDNGGSYSVIDKEDCDNCPNYCVMVGYK